MFWPFSPKSPTPSESKILVVFIAAVFFLMGIVSIFAGLHSSPDKHALAVVLEKRGAICLAIGILILLVYWLADRLLD